MTSGVTEPARILLIDDDVSIVALLTTALTKKGYVVTGAMSGEEGLEKFESDDFDLAIVDIGLPGMDGIAAARALRLKAGDQFVPIVMVTGTNEVEARLRAFEGGCDDYLVKPVNLFELQARVRSLIERRRALDELARANERLRELQRKKQDLAALVVHDLRNPLSAIQGNVELLLEDLADSAFFEGNDFFKEALGDCHKLAGRALFLVAGLLDVEELSEGLLLADPQQVDVSKVLQQATPHHEATIRMRELTLQFDCPDGLTAHLDKDLIGRLVENLLDNAVRYAPRGGRVVAIAKRDDEGLEIRVGNDGPPVPVAERERIFGRYYRLEARRAGARANRGLGLYFCKLAADAHDGTITVEETESMPTCFVVRIPQP